MKYSAKRVVKGRYASLMCVALLTSGCVLTRSSPDEATSLPPKAANEALLEAVELIAGGVANQPQRVLQDLDAAESAADNKELYAIKKLRPLIDRLLEPQPTLTFADYGEAAKIMNVLAKDHPDDFSWQLTTTMGLDFIGNILHSNPTQISSPEDEGSGAPFAVARALNLVGRFPTQSRAHAHLAQILTAAGGNQLSAMRSYVRCLQLDPNSAACKNGLRSLASDYTKPSCRDFRAEGFSLYKAAKTVAKATPTPVTVGKEALFIAPTPLLTGADLEGVSDSAGTMTLTLTPQGAARFETLTTELAQTEGFLVIKTNGKASTASRVISPVSTGQIQLAAGLFDINNACKTFDTKKLPEDVTGILR